MTYEEPGKSQPTWRRLSRDTDAEKIQMSDLSDKNFIEAIIKNAPTSNHKHSWDKVKIESLSKEMGNIKKNQMEI